MNKQEAIQKLKKHKAEFLDEYVDYSGITEALDMAIEALSAEAETKCIAQINVDVDEIVERIKEEYDIMDGWIPCSERLPEAKYGESARLLVTKCWKEDEDTQFVDEAYFNGSYWCEPTGECITNTKVVAWMPLPEPYREEQEHE